MATPHRDALVRIAEALGIPTGSSSEAIADEAERRLTWLDQAAAMWLDVTACPPGRTRQRVLDVPGVARWEAREQVDFTSSVELARLTRIVLHGEDESEVADAREKLELLLGECVAP